MEKLSWLKKALHAVCHIFELLCALLLVVSIALSIVGLARSGEVYRGLLSGNGQLVEFLEQLLIIVIGIEFLEMLCTPSSDNVIEILIFLVARHMIVRESTPFEDLASIASIVLLYVLRRWLAASKADPSGFLLPWRRREGGDAAEKKE